MAAFAFYRCFFADVMNKVHNLGSDELTIGLTNTAPVATHTTLADVTEITAANGYPADTLILSTVTSTQTAGVYSLTADDAYVTAIGGAMAQFRYAVLYNATAGDKLIGYFDNGTPVDLADTHTYTIAFTGGVVFTFQIDS
jgi:hypothetical protein